MAKTDIADPDQLHQLVLQSLDDDKAEEVVSIPLKGKSSIADYMVVASGRSSRQVASMARKLAEAGQARWRFGAAGRLEQWRLGADRYWRCGRASVPPRSAQLL